MDNIEVVRGLVKGREYAKQLQAMIVLGDHEGVTSAEELAQKVLRSFTDSLTKISLCRTNDLGQIRNSKEKDFGESSKKRCGEMMKDKRGCYKRRKEVVSWTIVSPTMEDGYAWRKYGQKDIQNSHHPRCYFRCTHKYDQECKALKQVQKVEGDVKGVYQTTYISQHTCKDQTRRAQIFQNSEVSECNSMIDFRVKMPETKLLQPIPTAIIKQESNGDTKSDLTDNVSSIDDSNNAMWPGVVESKDYSTKIGTYHDQEVASSLYARDALTSLGDLDFRSLNEFTDFPYEEL